MKFTKAMQLDAAKANFEACQRNLKANEIIWMDEWRAAANPFVAANVYLSAKQRARRKPIVDAWVKAKEELAALA